MVRALIKALLILAVVTALALWASLRSFQVFLAEDLVAGGQCEPAPPGASYGFLLEMRQMSGGLQTRRE